MARLPTLYIPHGGGPCFFMDWNPPDTWGRMAAWLRGLAADIGERPRAVLLISGHWEEPRVSVNVQTAPPLLFDYYGFPPHTYQLKYPAPGDPALAARVQALLTAGGVPVRAETERGLDHGVFVPFLLVYPQADVPIVQLSLHASLDASGNVIAWSHESYGDTHNMRPRSTGDRSGAARLLAARYLADPVPPPVAQPSMGHHVGIHRNQEPLYDFPDPRLVKNLVRGLPLRTSVTLA